MKTVLFFISSTRYTCTNGLEGMLQRIVAQKSQFAILTAEVAT